MCVKNIDMIMSKFQRSEHILYVPLSERVRIDGKIFLFAHKHTEKLLLNIASVDVYGAGLSAAKLPIQLHFL